MSLAIKSLAKIAEDNSSLPLSLIKDILLALAESDGDLEEYTFTSNIPKLI